MREVTGNLWAYHDAGEWIAITTNGILRKDGACVMGRGVAREAAERDVSVPYLLGTAIKRAGNHVAILAAKRLISYPVKRHWRDPADLALIRRSAAELVTAIHAYNDTGPVPITRLYLVRPGCGNGRLRWADVKHVIAPILPDWITIVEKQP